MLADQFVRDGEEYVVDLKEHEKPVTCEDYEKELEEQREREEKEKNLINNLKEKLSKYKDKFMRGEEESYFSEQPIYQQQRHMTDGDSNNMTINEDLRSNYYSRFSPEKHLA